MLRPVQVARLSRLLGSDRKPSLGSVGIGGIARCSIVRTYRHPLERETRPSRKPIFRFRRKSARRSTSGLVAYRLVSSHAAPLDARLATGVRGYHPLFVLRFLSPLFKSFFEPLLFASVDAIFSRLSRSMLRSLSNVFLVGNHPVTRLRARSLSLHDEKATRRRREGDPKS